MHRTTLMILKGSFCMYLATILLCYNLCNGHFCHLLKIVPFLECEVFFFSAVSWHSATLVLFLLFCLLCSICFAMYKKKSDKDFIGGHQIVANLFVFFFR